MASGSASGGLTSGSKPREFPELIFTTEIGATGPDLLEQFARHLAGIAGWQIEESVATAEGS